VRMYLKFGYKTYRIDKVAKDVDFVYMEKFTAL